ncbi:TPA: hypothetical protein ACH3X2_012406 [Trebouxia sp. C0005]
MDLPTQALALGYLSLSWGFGTILGDLSEESSDPPWEELWHSLAKRMVQAFLSVSLVSSLRPGSELSDLSAAPARKPSRQVRRGDSAEEMHSPEPGKWSSVAATIDELSPMAGTVGIELVPQTLVTISASQGTEPSSEQTATAAIASSGQQDDLQDAISASGSSQANQDAKMHESDSEHAVLMADSEELQPQGPGEQKQSRREAAAVDRQRVWYQERQVQLTILGYGSIAFLLTPLFAAAPPAIGGVGLLASQLAVPLVFCGVVLMWYAVYGYPWFQRNYGAGFSCRVGLLVTAPTVLLIPVSHYFSWSVIAAQLALCLILGLKSMGAANAFSGSMILVNNASPKHAFGKVNGCGQMVASFVRAIGPAGAGLVWGGTAQLQLAGKHFMPFALVTAVALLTQLLYVFVKLPVLDK